jgi:ADP-L-glycero-D-manno-heptose 6-epimerase
MKILVTGSSGFIGRHMYHALARHDVRGMEWGDAFPEVAGLDWVIHMGAISSTTERDVEKIMCQNLDFSCALLDDCIKANVNFQYASSASIYGLGQDFTESAPPDPRTPYAWSKYLFERYAKQKQDLTDIRIQGFRYFNVYGDGEEHKGNQASPFTQFAKQCREHASITLFRYSDKYERDFVPVQTVIDTHRKFFNISESGIWNLGTGRSLSFYDIAKSFGCALEFVDMPQNMVWHYQTRTCANLEKITKSINNIEI